MLVFLLGQLPLPIVLYLNWRVTMHYVQVRRLAKSKPVPKPKRLIAGWLLNNTAIIFILVPVISERQLFVQNPAWLWWFGCAATMTISGLLLMDSALSEELRLLRRRQGHSKPVDRQASDTL